jgi:hypothetical protein
MARRREGLKKRKEKGNGENNQMKNFIFCP